LNTVCSPCIIKLNLLKRNLPELHLPFEGITVKRIHAESPGFTYQNTSNLETMEKSQVDENFQTEKTTEIGIKAERSIDSTDEVDINNSQVCESAGNIRKLLTCEFCPKEFNHAGDLNKHRRKHTGEQPYACNTCERKFTTSSNLVRHQQIHFGIKPFRCQICGRTFTRKIKLSAHLIAKHHEALKSGQSMV